MQALMIFYKLTDSEKIMAESVVEFFSSDSTKELIAKLKEAGVNMKSTNVVEDTRFSGMTFVLTGTFF